MSGFGVDPSQQPAPDPSQIFPHPSQLPAMQQGQPQPPEPGEAPEQPHDVGGETLDAEVNILEAIEMGCEMCLSATDVNAEDFMRFAQGVQFLSIALSNLQPKPTVDPAAAQLAGTALRVDQAHSAAMMKAAKDLHSAQTQHDQAVLRDAQQAAHPPQPPQPPGQQVPGQQPPQGAQQPPHQQQPPPHQAPHQAPGQQQASHPGQQPPSARG